MGENDALGYTQCPCNEYDQESLKNQQQVILVCIVQMYGVKPKGTLMIGGETSFHTGLNCINFM